MPEGPEIHRAAGKIGAALCGGKVLEAFFKFESLKPFETYLVGRRVESVTARGKAMVIAFEEGQFLYSHNQLYGRWMIRKRDKPPKTNRDLRVMLKTQGASAYLYSASEIEMLGEADLKAHAYLKRLGPDIVLADWPLDRVMAHLRERRFERRALGGLLLDQAFLAGVGNYLRSEILHVCGLHPEQKIRHLGDGALENLYQRSCALAQQSLRHGGVTQDLARAQKMKAAGAPRWAYRHWVFVRGGRPCHTCGEKIQKLYVAARQLYLCPRCQKGAL